MGGSLAIFKLVLAMVVGNNNVLMTYLPTTLAVPPTTPAQVADFQMQEFAPFLGTPLVVQNEFHLHF